MAVLGIIWVPQQLVPFYRFFFGWEGSPNKIDHRRKKVGTLILASLREDLGHGWLIVGDPKMAGGSFRPQAGGPMCFWSC